MAGDFRRAIVAGLVGAIVLLLLLAWYVAKDTGAWVRALFAYQFLTLIVLVAGIALVLHWAWRRVQPRLRAPDEIDAPRRETDFVVETFQSVIGELQVKGLALEQDRERERQRAERSERFSERVIAQMPLGLVVIDRQGRITAANQSARDLFPALPANRADEIGYEKVFEPVPELLEPIRSSLKAKGTLRREVEMRAQDGSAKHLGLVLSSIEPSEGSSDAVLCLLADLTETVELRERLRQQENLADLGEMAAGLTHELKNSLATIQGYSQLLADLVPPDSVDIPEALAEEVRDLTRVVTDFLNFARPQDPVLTEFVLADLIGPTLVKLQERIEASRIELCVNIAPIAAEAAVMGDELLLSRVFLNLVMNALDALETVEGSRRLEILLDCSPPTEITLSVRDSGPGIPPEDISKIFIPFFTTKSRGYGIGLALTQKIVLSHKGRIAVENLDKGTQFRCSFPMAQASNLTRS